MEPSAYLILMTASAVNMALPGPAIILTFTRASCQGLSAAASVAMGLLLSSLTLALGAVLILAGLLELSQNALAAARWAGLAVMLWIALRLIFAPAMPTPNDLGPARAGDLLAGFAIGITSPFNILFLLALLPQFAPERIGAETAVAMIAAYVFGQFLVLAAASTLGAAAGRAFLGKSRNLLIQRLAGVALAGFALTASTLPV